MRMSRWVKIHVSKHSQILISKLISHSPPPKGFVCVVLTKKIQRCRAFPLLHSPLSISPLSMLQPPRACYSDDVHALTQGQEDDIVPCTGGARAHSFSTNKNQRTSTGSTSRRAGRGPSAGSVGDKGCRITGGPWGAEQVNCLKHEQTERTATWHDVDTHFRAHRVPNCSLALCAQPPHVPSDYTHTQTLTTHTHKWTSSAACFWPETHTIWQVYTRGSAEWRMQSIGTLKLHNLRVWILIAYLQMDAHRNKDKGYNASILWAFNNQNKLTPPNTEQFQIILPAILAIIYSVVWRILPVAHTTLPNDRVS